MKLNYKIIFAMIGLVVVLTGCSRIVIDKRDKSFEKTFNAYRIYIRWGDFGKAMAFVKMRQGEPEQPDLNFLKQIKLTRYDTVNEVVNLDEKEYPVERIVDIDIEYYREENMTVKNLHYSQVWWYDPLEERWFLDSNLPPFK